MIWELPPDSEVMYFVCTAFSESESYDLLEGVSIVGLLDGLDDGLVDSEGDGNAEQCQE